MDGPHGGHSCSLCAEIVWALLLILEWPNADQQSSPSRAVVQESVAPITYVTLTAEHLPQVHDILHRSFWSGIDGSCPLLLIDGSFRPTRFHPP